MNSGGISPRLGAGFPIGESKLSGPSDGAVHDIPGRKSMCWSTGANGINLLAKEGISLDGLTRQIR